jgi:hypothetical protein
LFVVCQYGLYCIFILFSCYHNKIKNPQSVRAKGG